MGTCDEFGSRPLFRVFGSFIAVGFILIGFGGPLRLRKGAMEMLDEMMPKPPPTQLACQHCGANLGSAEVSPSGDVKCSYCKGWFNVHGG